MRCDCCGCSRLKRLGAVSTDDEKAALQERMSKREELLSPLYHQVAHALAMMRPLRLRSSGPATTHTMGSLIPDSTADRDAAEVLRFVNDTYLEVVVRDVDLVVVGGVEPLVGGES